MKTTILVSSPAEPTEGGLNSCSRPIYVSLSPNEAKRRSELDVLDASIRLYLQLAHRERGQTMAEYAIVLAVISIAIIGALGLLGTNIKTAVSGVASKV
jgi:Flp pilus assembly pilin Flp